MSVRPADGIVVHAAGLTKRYPPAVDALAGVSLAVRRGEFVAVLGPGGAGKTALFRCLTGLTRPDTGMVTVNGQELTSLRGRALGAAQLALRCLDTVGPIDRAYTRADQLSGGQQQRVAIARALAQDAKVILADEPVASLDPESAGTVLESLRAVVATGVAVVASLHQVHLALQHADRVVAMRNGRVVEDAPTARMNAHAIELIYGRNGGVAP